MKAITQKHKFTRRKFVQNVGSTVLVFAAGYLATGATAHGAYACGDCGVTAPKNPCNDKNGKPVAGGCKQRWNNTNKSCRVPAPTGSGFYDIPANTPMGFFKQDCAG